MLCSLNQLTGFPVHATDGYIGSVTEVYFDDREWMIRYLVVETGHWLSSRRVLLSTLSTGKPDWKFKKIPVRLTREMVRTSPEIDTDKPVGLQHQMDLHAHYGWAMYWSGESILGNTDMVPFQEPAFEKSNRNSKPFNQHLRTTGILTGYRVHAFDGDVGHVIDYVIDDAAWMIHHLVIDTGNIFSPRPVEIPTVWVKNIDWETRKLHVNADSDAIRNSPKFTLPELFEPAYEDVLF